MADPIPFRRAGREGYVNPPVDPPTGGGDDGGMENRLTALETRFDTVIPTLATKVDIGDTKIAIGETRTAISELRSEMTVMESKLVKWMAGIGIATVTVMISVLGFLFARIDTKGSQPQPPIIINIPQAAQPAAPQPLPK